MPFKNSSKASAWATVLGKPSKRKPLSQSSFVNLSLTIPIVTSSGTNWPLSIYLFASIPKGVFSFMFALNISPVDIWGIENFLLINFAWVPLPAPGGPNKITRIHNHLQNIFILRNLDSDA